MAITVNEIRLRAGKQSPCDLYVNMFKSNQKHKSNVSKLQNKITSNVESTITHTQQKGTYKTVNLIVLRA